MASHQSESDEVKEQKSAEAYPDVQREITHHKEIAGP
jgi:hypothetical protein